ncbi:unnamed protein product [Orchesella dallaii]|uniref:Uncharacterized protein n=1 Tax=Orchesella dallaii TaxID=48710 RepID=A0ABP1PNX6_9HEXA
MLRNIIAGLVVVALVAIASIHGATVPLGKNTIKSQVSNRFVFIGSSKNLVSDGGKGKGRSTYQESLYFLSQNAAGQEMANVDCVNIFGPGSGLVNIETAEELGNIAALLRESGDSGTLYWTSGRFNIDDRVFEWGNGVGLNSSVPWSANHPNSQVSVTRVALYTVGSPKLRTQFNTVSSRNIIFGLIVVASAAIASTYGAAVPLEENTIESQIANRFVFIGSAKNLVSTGGKGSATFEESMYFLSQNAAGQEMANMDCVNIFGPEGGLVNIETVEELGNITSFLRESGDSGTLYWTSGRFNIDDQVFEWGNGVRLSPSAPWSANHPNSQVSVTRVALYTVGSPKLRTQFNTVSSRYMCELKLGEVGEEAEPCYSDNDLVIVVDSSGSIGQVNYMGALEFAAKLATAWIDNPNNRISVVIYSSSVQSVIGLGESVTVSQLRDRVYNAPYLNGGTASDLGINKAVSEFQSNSRAVPKNMVFLTDGVSNSASATLAAAQAAQSAGIRGFSVGITTNINQQELLAIAGNNADHVFNTDGFEDLLKLLQPVSRRVCA